MIKASRQECKKFFRDKNLKDEIIDEETMKQCNFYFKIQQYFIK